jgi:hypothetical protein
MENLDAWRAMTTHHNPEMGWDDDDYFTSDINAARMRGKYYGAKYIINRPTLHAALHDDWASVSIPPSAPPIASQGQGWDSSLSPSHQPYQPLGRQQQLSDSPVGSRAYSEVRSVDRLKPEVYEGVKACIHAAIRSTTAFDAVPPRIIITNVFGTGHA